MCVRLINMRDKDKKEKEKNTKSITIILWKLFTFLPKELHHHNLYLHHQYQHLDIVDIH